MVSVSGLVWSGTPVHVHVAERQAGKHAGKVAEWQTQTTRSDQTHAARPGQASLVDTQNGVLGVPNTLALGRREQASIRPTRLELNSRESIERVWCESGVGN